MRSQANSASTENESDALRSSAAEFILEGLYAHKRISRNEEQAFAASERPSRPERPSGTKKIFAKPSIPGATRVAAVAI